MSKSLIAKLLSNDWNPISESLQNFFFSVHSPHCRYNLMKILKEHFNKKKYDKSL